MHGDLVSLDHGIPKPDHSTPLGHRQLLKDDLNMATFLGMACMAQEEVLQILIDPKWDNKCISWRPDFTPVRGPGLQNGLQQPHQ